MRGGSQASYEAVEGRFESVLRSAGVEAVELGEQMLAVVDLLDSSGAIRRGLTDPARSPQDKAALAEHLLDGKADDRVVAAVGDLARQRWSVERDLTEALERMAAEWILQSAEASSDLKRVEEELFAFDRFLVGERRVRDALTDRLATPEARAALVDKLLDGKVHPVTLILVRRGAQTPRGRSMTRTLTDLGRLAAHRRDLMIVTVTAAVRPAERQMDRLGRMVAEAVGRKVQVNVAVDRQVIGGMQVQIGDEVVDSTMLGRLEDVRRRFAG